MLKVYNKKLLNFMYQLTKLKRFESYRKLSRHITVDEGRHVSPKTVQKWIKFLSEKVSYNNKKLVKFLYYPTFFYEKFGLRRVFVLSQLTKETKNNIRNILKIDYNDYACWLYDTTKLSYVLLTAYLIPKGFNLKKRFNELKKQGTLSDYEIISTHKGFYFYSPWSKVIDRYGNFHPENNDKGEIEQQIEKFKYYVKHLPKIEVIKQVKQNPLIVPAVFEYSREYYSSRKVWFALKKKLKQDVWLYIRRRKKETDYVGIKRVQQALNDIHKTGIFHQIRVEYLPLEFHQNFYVYGLSNANSLYSITSNSISSCVHPLHNRLFFISLTNKEGLFNMLSKIRLDRLMLLDYKRSLNLLLRAYKFNYRLFDPVNCRWKK